MRRIFSLLVAAALSAACASRGPGYGAPDARPAPLFSDLGNYHHEITTKDPRAQRYFDQGLTLAYGFNHREAVRSFLEGARIDPDCAMCWWGASLALGPNINTPMFPEDVKPAWEYLQKAQAAAPKVSEREQAYIQALSKRYAPAQPDDRKPLDMAYARAMGEVAKRHPDDLDAATLFAEALMDTRPWHYWTREGKPEPETPEILAALEGVLAKKPDHVGATHFYIHVTEASPDPTRGVAAADRLRDLVPGAGHLVHMPGHTYLRVGRYADASEVNEKAILADQSYVAQCQAQGVYPLAYVPHNYHFLWSAASFEGRSRRAIEAARAMASHQDHRMMRTEGLAQLQDFWITPVYALVRFGRWDEALKEPRPDKDLLYPTGVWHYSRGMALAAKGDLAGAEKELAALAAVSKDPSMEKLTFFDTNTAARVLSVGREVLAGEIAGKRRDWDTAVARLNDALEIERGLTYTEPPQWHAPVRHNLGAVLLAAGRAAEAEKVYRDDLAYWPENGWSLFGLEQALAAQGKTAEAADAAARFAKAWSRADVTLTASRF
jgi:tetratricopeptide (TPR) repeat protein